MWGKGGLAEKLVGVGAVQKPVLPGSNSGQIK